MGRLEVDLVAFFEVKTRKTAAFASLLQAVTWAKRREIVLVVRAWVDRHGRPDDVYRFDVLGVTLLPAGRPRVDHVEDAVQGLIWKSNLFRCIFGSPARFTFQVSRFT
jgi:Holliday junction resolvase-like predicted endonuclease